jgi:predicted DNA-binding transcriptional regulator YafY
MERAQRIARINVLLRQHHGVTMAQLMEDLSVSRATVNRDLDLMRDQMHAPIVWDRDDGVYRLEAENHTGPAYMLPGLWFTPQQAYALLTMQNMIEKIAPNLLGPFLDPMRSMLKEMLWKADFHLYGLDKKIEIDMPAMPALGDLDFSILLEALVNDQPVRLTLLTPAGKEETLAGLPVKLRIASDRWVIDVRPESDETPLKIDVGLIRKAVLLSGEVEEDE